MRRRALPPLLTALALAACSPEAPPEATPAATPAPEPGFAGEFAGPIERAHARDVWRTKRALETGVRIEFGGRTVLDGRMLFETDMHGSRLELRDGTVAVYDGSEAWVAPGDAGLEDARFHLLTWPYFAAAPMKLRDPGTRLEPAEARELDGVSHPAARLSFEPGVGDTPDDWYVVYRDPETSRLAAMAYIVTWGTSRQEAEEEPHAITFHDYADVEGVPIPTRWVFRLWSEEQGIHGDALGQATLEEPRFVDPAEGAFRRPEGARAAPLPGAEEPRT